MKRGQTTIWLAAGLTLALLSPLAGQATAQGATHTLLFKPSLGVEFFSRTIEWDEGLSTSKLKAWLFTFNMDVEFLKGVSAGAVLGYSLSNPSGLVFRKLPFSVDYEAGSLNGLVLGAELKVTPLSTESFRLDLVGQFVTYRGFEGSWDIEDLAVPGSLTGKTHWYRVSAGPVLWYTGYMYFSPFLQVCYNTLWGTFHMEEEVGPLSGLEDKSYTSRGFLSVSLGTLYEPTPGIGFKGEASVIPHGGGVDIGLQAKLILTF